MLNVDEDEKMGKDERKRRGRRREEEEEGMVRKRGRMLNGG
jgi:hypothetical protein